VYFSFKSRIILIMYNKKKGDKMTTTPRPMSTTKETQSINDFQVDTRKQYSAIDITNAVEKTLLENGYCKTDSFEMNSFLMDVLSKVGHYHYNNK